MNQITDDDATPTDLDQARADIALREKSKADARALWAWRTLAQYYAHEGAALHLYAVHAAGYERLAIAKAQDVYPDLPEAVRRELGECPT